VLGGFESEVGDSGEGVAQVYYEVVTFGLDRAVFAVEEDLEAWEAEGGEDGEEAGVGVFWGCQFQTF
jgi:hypothetical protein